METWQCVVIIFAIMAFAHEEVTRIRDAIRKNRQDDAVAIFKSQQDTIAELRKENSELRKKLKQETEKKFVWDGE